MENRPVAFITGASRGIGEAIAQRLARDGYSLTLCCRGAIDALAQVADDCQKQGAQVLALQGDCGDAEVCKTWIAKATERFGRIDVLVNNAGVTRDGLLARMTNEQFDEVMRTNLNGAFYLCREVSRLMMKQRFGRIVNIGSVVGQTGNPGQSNYAASKAALVGFTKSIAKELASRGVTANVVAPGLIASDMTDALSEDVRKTMTDKVLCKRAGKPAEVAALVSFLAGEDASYITGQVITIDGGLTL